MAMRLRWPISSPLVDLGSLCVGRTLTCWTCQRSRNVCNTHPINRRRRRQSGTSRALFDCLDIPLTPTGPLVRMLLAARPASASPPSIGVLRNGRVYEQFFTTVPPNAFTPADVLDLYLHRGSFETVLADEDA